MQNGNNIKANTISVNGQLVKFTDTMFGAIQKKETDKAILFEIFSYSDSANVAGNSKEVWLPKSQIKQTDTHVIDVAEWLFNKHFMAL